eukprot:CAMPEP_0172842242 /NCGR_PEP_ID=MMETSP1075-20121228/30577_1 /TAXON_ID=2916 /ORGANISM="Ceratium fusus, Strain PA161109" /LENGTH=40 /DNA_ID= /DNA_START= /DNA_END= /DNA_ORIENTATION=
MALPDRVPEGADMLLLRAPLLGLGPLLDPEGLGTGGSVKR